MPEGLALVDVREVDLDHRALAGVQRVEDRDGGVREGGRVDHDSARALARFVIQSISSYSRLLWWKRSSRPCASAMARPFPLDVDERVAPVDLGLPRPEQVQVGPFRTKTRRLMASLRVRLPAGRGLREGGKRERGALRLAQARERREIDSETSRVEELRTRQISATGRGRPERERARAPASASQAARPSWLALPPKR
jgi:hypothetical protein